MTSNDQFVVSSGYKKWSYALIAVGVVALAVSFFTLGMGDEHHKARFWASLLQNSLFFMMIVNASMFFICATTMAFGGWQTAFRRVPEAISATLPVMAIIAFAILMAIVYGHQHHIYHWVDAKLVQQDPILKWKSSLLNPTVFTIWTAITLLIWWFVGKKMRDLSAETDIKPMSYDEGKKWIHKNTVWAAVFLVFYGLTVASTIPWLWLMSIDAHWYSTMYSWYTFASTFVGGMSLIALFVIYLKNQDKLTYVNDEHLHDIGKFMFAFSVFWTYLWFSQYMLIWYANIPEETTYFKPRTGHGAYSVVFWLNFLINFICPLLILMTRGAKRNYTLMAFMGVLLIFGHWLDFFQMIFPGVNKIAGTEKSEFFTADLMLSFGIGLGFVGLIILLVGHQLAKRPLTAKYHPFLKESIIHHT
jgi:hypothetical protein